MTEQEIEKLREKLGSDYSVKRQNGAITVELADIWNGVEFAECVSDVKVDWYGKEIAKGHIYRIVDRFKREVIYIDQDELGWQSKHFKPSTESAYVEQLKAKAKTLYGEIKDGNQFEFTWMGDVIERSIHLKGKYDFYYDKESDALYLYGFPLYKQGKWAKKGEEPIRVEFVNIKVNAIDADQEGFIYSFNTGGINLIIEEPSDKNKLEEDHIEPIKVTAYASGLMRQVKHKMNITLEVSRPFTLNDRFEFLSHIEEAIEDYLNKIP